MKRYFKYLVFLPVVLMLALTVQPQSLQAATIGGNVFSGQGTVSWVMNIMGFPVAQRLPVFTDPMNGGSEFYQVDGARVMVQDMETGAFVAYGTFPLVLDPLNPISGVDNNWTANVPDGGLYVATYSAPGHQTTSRVFDLTSCGPPNVCSYLPAVTQVDAYLPMLYRDLNNNPDPLNAEPRANMLAYAYTENAVNGADDGVLKDPPLAGVFMELFDMDGLLVQSCTSGNGSGSFTTKGGMIYGPGFIDSTGYCHFTDLVPGKYKLRGTPPALATGEYYYTYTMEGGQEWDIILEPGSPGTEGGGYLAWFGFVDNNINNTDPLATGSIGGFIEDADGLGWEADEPGIPLIPQKNIGVTPNEFPKDAYVVLWTDTPVTKVVAVADASNVDGRFDIYNVPAGQYFMFISDKPLNYVFKEYRITVGTGHYEFSRITDTILVPNLFATLPAFGGTISGTVSDTDGLGVLGATVNVREKSGNVLASTTTDAAGNYAFGPILEIETMAFMDVTPPANYRGSWVTDVLYPNAFAPADPITGIPCNPALPGCVTLGDPLNFDRNGAGRYIQWFTGTYDSNFILEKINVPTVPPAAADVSYISGWVFSDSLEAGTWIPDNVWDQENEGVVEGVTIELVDSLGAVVASTTSGSYNLADVIGQGYTPTGQQVPGGEWGGLFSGPILGFYEFRGLETLGVTPGAYELRVTLPAGFSLSPSQDRPISGTVTIPVTITGIDDIRQDIGLTTRVPRAGILAGGMFDDINLDTRPWSAFGEEKAIMTGIGIVARDYLGYEVDALVQPSAVCYGLGEPLTTSWGLEIPANRTTDLPLSPLPADLVPHGAICDRPDLGYGIEIERRISPTTLLYTGNDPSLAACPSHAIPDPALVPLSPPGFIGDPPCYNADFEELELPYNMKQGIAALADWSLAPPGVDAGGIVMPILGATMCPVITHFSSQVNVIDGDNINWSSLVIIELTDEFGVGVPNAEIWATFTPFESKVVFTNGYGMASFMAKEIVNLPDTTFTVDLVKMPDFLPQTPAWSTAAGCAPSVVIPRPAPVDPAVVVPAPIVAPTPPPVAGGPVGAVAVSNIAPQGFDLGEGKWMGEAVVTITDSVGTSVDGVKVSYRFGAGEVKASKTQADGTVKVSSETFEGGPEQVIFTVTNVKHPQYDAAANLMSEVLVQKP